MSAPAVDSFRMQLPHRKPLATQAPAPRRPSNGSSFNIPTTQQSGTAQPMTMSNRRTLSNATTSTASSSSLPKHSTSIRRSNSNRSSNTGSSYTAMMRRQKATVWCDRAQAEDPRIQAAQRIAKERAQREVSGAIGALRPLQAASGGSFTGGVARKIRHHGALKTNTFKDAGNMAGAGVPMRLSATEVEDELEEKEWEKDGWNYGQHQNYHSSASNHHTRTPSGRSSLGSGRRILAGPHHQSNSNLRGMTTSATSSPHSRSPSDSIQSEHEQKTPMPQTHPKTDYFSTGISRTKTQGSGSSEEKGFGGLGQMPIRTKPLKDEKASADELRRRGSVDDRTMTMNGGVRLFVANPDLSD